MYLFVTGGFRSGRSNYALRRATELGSPPWLYLSTGVDTDEAIEKRTGRHRRDAEAIWRTEVAPEDLLVRFSGDPAAGCGAVVLDGFETWLAGRLARAPGDTDGAVLDEVERLAERLYRARPPVVVVSTEVSLSVPELPDAAATGDDPRPAAGSGRATRFLRVAASANQILARNAGGVVLMVSGVPLKVR